MRSTMLWAAVVLAVAPACSKSHPASNKNNPPAPPKAAPQKAAEKPPAAKTSDLKAADPEIKLASVDNKMKFDKTKLTVKTGEKVHLVFHNNATLKVLPHDWVLVKPGTQAKVAKAGLKAGKAHGYVKPGPDVLAYTPLAEPGKTVSVTFKAPAPGSYPYICTVPGHYVVMNGTLVVTH